MSWSDWFSILSQVIWWSYFYLYIYKSDHIRMRGTYPSPAIVEYTLPDNKGRCKIKWANATACLLIRRRRDELIGLNTDQLIANPKSEEFRRMLEKSFDELLKYGTATFKYEYLTGDGEIITLRSELYLKYNHFLRHFLRINKLKSIMGYCARVF